MPEKLNIVVMGTGPFAVPLFEALAVSDHNICALVTQPARPPVGNKPAPVNPMRTVGERLGLPIHTPQSINTDEVRAELAAYQPDLFVVADYGQILKPETLGVARLGGLNLHGSLLPKYRGAAPINWAIYNGDAETGVTVIQMTPRIDAGPAIGEAKLLIRSSDTAETIEPQLAELGANLIRRCVDVLATNPERMIPLPQVPEQVTKAPRLKKSDGDINWNRTAQQVRDQWRAMQPWPKCYSHWLRENGKPMRLIFGPIQTVELEATAEPGVVISADDEGIIIKAGSGAVIVRELQPAGKRMLSVAEFLNGYRVEPGDRFGTP